MSFRTSKIADRYFYFLQRFILPRIPSALARPNFLTCLGLFFACLVPFAFRLHPLLGGLGIGFSGLADTLDGLSARVRQQGSRFGAFLDSSLDRLSDSLYLLGFWVLFWETPWYLSGSFGIFLSLILTEMISYIKARAEGLGGRCSAGLLQRDLRVVYLLLWSLALGLVPGADSFLLWGGLILYIILAMTTIVQRMREVATSLTD